MTSQPASPDIWRQLRQQIQDLFDFQELRELTFDLGVDYEALGEGLGKSERVIKLIEHSIHHNYLPNLLAALQQARPSFEWPQEADLPQTSSVNLNYNTLLKLYSGLVSAFDLESLTGLVTLTLQRKLEIQSGLSMRALVYQVLETATLGGWLLELVEAICTERAENKRIQAICAELVSIVTMQNLSPQLAKLRYLHSVIERSERYLSGELYVDMATEALQSKPAIKGRSDAARRVLDRQHRVFKDRRRGLKDDTSQSQSIDSFDGLYKYVCEAKHVALIGDPGSGKTTTLLQLARKLALAAIEEPMEPLPLFVPLSMVKNANFDELFETHLAAYELKLHDYWPNRIFLLLDGLNEMPGAHVAALPEWLERTPNVAVVVTCRKLDYFGFRVPLNRVDIVPLDVARIYEFLRRYLTDEDVDKLFWRLAGKKAPEAWTWWQKEWSWRVQTEIPLKEEKAFTQFWHGKIDRAGAWEIEKSYLKHLQDALRREGRLPGLLGVATNPFFLMAIVDIYLSNGDLYQNRGQLIAEFADMLLVQTTETSSPISLITKPIDLDRSAIAEMAYQMQAERTGTVADVAWVEKTLTTRVPNVDVESMLRRLASNQILDVVPGETVGFTHQLLQEYFTAVKLDEAIRSGVETQVFWPDEAWWTQTGWEEPAILLAGFNEDATPIVQWLMMVQPTLAFRCATESGATCDTETLQALYEPVAGARVSPEARFEWGKLLALRGDQRSGVGLDSNGLPDIDWCHVSEGEFLFGRRREKRTLPSFSIARYPVTIMQLQVFTDTPDGYQNSAWWQGLPNSKRRIANPTFDYANHPRENVSWYDAIAFCRWLSVKLRRNITLPTEQQWEKAARGIDGRAWPWGDEYLVGYANVDERDEHNPIGPTYLRSTTAVGLYPWGKSPYGVMDMCGNVWEWCLNDSNDRDGSAMGNLIAEKQLRGGSWNNNIDVAPTYHRYTDWVSRPLLPTYQNWRVGFRVVALD